MYCRVTSVHTAKQYNILLVAHKMLYTYNLNRTKLIYTYSVNIIPNLCFLCVITIWLCTFNRGCIASRATLDLYKGKEKFSINTKDCPAGMLSNEPTTFTCTCVTGVWGLYHKYCASPFSVIGGDNYCVRLPSGKVSQVMIFGNPKYPFEPSLSHFTGKFYQMTKFFLSDDDTVDLDGDSTFISITNVSWTIYGDNGDSVCLKATKPGARTFCRFGYESAKALLDLNWKLIVKIQKGCFGNITFFADTCYRILPPNDIGACDRDIENETNDTSEENWIRLPKHPKNKSETNSSEVWFPLPKNNKNKTKQTPLKNASSDEDIWWIPLSKHSSTTPKTFDNNTSWWIPLPKHPSFTPSPTDNTSTTLEPESTTEKAEEEKCSEGLTREAVKKYWRSSANEPCAKSITEAVFTDQLRRLATLQMDKIIESRLRSLQQVEILMNISLKIMEKTCPSEIVSSEFFTVAMSAFLMFVKEDFFYGVEQAEKEKFQRIQFDLEKCLAEATPFAFETVPLDCQFNQITGAMILPGRRKVLTIPQNDASDSYEPLIESAWKIFLNVHTYCFKHFRYPNDHHHFSVFIMGAFTKSIYEKWIEPLESKELYSLILPNFKYVKETMKNIDYCVAAANTVSSCPAWLERSSSVSGLANKKRKKRSIWVNFITDNRQRASMWNGTAFCLQKMDEPEFKLGFGRCSHPL